ncbi:hypothetical protein [Nostoc sp.]
MLVRTFSDGLLQTFLLTLCEKTSSWHGSKCNTYPISILCKLKVQQLNSGITAFFTALPAAMRYILKAESDDRRGTRRKLYCIIAGSAVKVNNAEVLEISPDSEVSELAGLQK